MKEANNRRPLKVRSLKAIIKIASWINSKNVTPNHISLISILFSVFAAICFSLEPLNHPIAFLFVAFFIQCRLLCNLFDGMVAVEGGRKTASGELFNDIPDRIADSIILISAGYAIGDISSLAVPLGYLSALFSVMTAYIRTLSSSIGAPVNFQGPMAKQHRMAVMTLACIVSSIYSDGYILLVSLLIIATGAVITVYNRAKFAYHFLESK